MSREKEELIMLKKPVPSRGTAGIRRQRQAHSEDNREFYECISDIIYHPKVLEMKRYYQHCNTDCYEHCLSVAYYNYYICKKLKLDARSAARGGMLHDLFLYDWRGHSRRTGDHFHAMTHPRAAYNMAKRYFDLNKIEKEVILKHMWPVTVIPPRYWETYVICFTDKYCSSREIADYYARQPRARWILLPLLGAMRRLTAGIPELQKEMPELFREESSSRSAAQAQSFAQLRRRPSGAGAWGNGTGRVSWPRSRSGKI